MLIYLSSINGTQITADDDEVVVMMICEQNLNEHQLEFGNSERGQCRQFDSIAQTKAAVCRLRAQPNSPAGRLIMQGEYVGCLSCALNSIQRHRH